MKKLICKIAATSLAFVATILAIVGIALLKTNEIKIALNLNAITIIAALALLCVGFLLVTLLKKDNKMFLLISMIILLVGVNLFSTILTSIFSTTEETTTNPSLISILEIALLIVAYVFALKDKKWGSIVVIVILALNLVTLYTSFISLNASIANLEAETTYISNTTQKLISSYKGMEMLILAIELGFVSQITYFCTNLINEDTKTKEDSKQETIEENKTEE